jgi:hypothetical protein
MRKLAVESGVWQGWQAGKRLKESESFLSLPIGLGSSRLFRAGQNPAFAWFTLVGWDASGRLET